LQDENRIKAHFLSCFLALAEDWLSSITDKGCDNSAVMENSLPSVARGRCNRAISQHNSALRRESQLIARVDDLEDGRCQLTLGLSDDAGQLLHLTLAVPARDRGQQAADRFRQAPDRLLHTLLAALLNDEKEGE